MAKRKTRTKPQGRYTQLLRMFRVLRLLCDGPQSLDDLCRAFSRDKKTIRRDIVALRSLGIPIERRTPHGYPAVYALDPNAFIDWLMNV